MNLTTVVIHKRDEQPGDVYVGRGSKLGNPYRIGVDGNRKQVIAKFKRLLINQLRSPDSDVRDYLKSLRGKRLVCWCKPLACHGDVIAEFVNMDDEELDKMLSNWN